jgi:hypothetical protein
MRRAILALVMAALLARPCSACYPAAGFAYRQCVPFRSRVSVLAIPAYYTVPTLGLYAGVPCGASYGYAGSYSAAGPCQSQTGGYSGGVLNNSAGIAEAPLGATPVMPYAEGYASAGAAYQTGGYFAGINGYYPRTRYFGGFAGISGYSLGAGLVRQRALLRGGFFGAVNHPLLRGLGIAAARPFLGAARVGFAAGRAIGLGLRRPIAIRGRFR